MKATITAAPVRKIVRVEASRERAFEVFTGRMSAWWPKTHSVNAGHPQDKVIVEPRPGGRWYEVGVDGAECSWGEVLAWEPPSRVMLSWHLNSQFQFDRSVKSEIEVRFFAEGANATRVELEHRIAAPDAQEIRTVVDGPNGWSMILAGYADCTGTKRS